MNWLSRSRCSLSHSLSSYLVWFNHEDISLTIGDYSARIRGSKDADLRMPTRLSQLSLTTFTVLGSCQDKERRIVPLGSELSKGTLFSSRYSHLLLMTTRGRPRMLMDAYSLLAVHIIEELDIHPLVLGTTGGLRRLVCCACAASSATCVATRANSSASLASVVRYLIE